ncbi:MAG: Suppressor of the cold-sensitive snRNP biogenesis mutant brr1-1 [Bogoriella megaspora]|nr:MAG: Suppressor of the cold-sensitive snRNP biogenesis mutant brr1-1 [Bogoriella megaspora]
MGPFKMLHAFSLILLAIFIKSSPVQLHERRSNPDLAPYNRNDPSRLVPDTYIVVLRDGHTFDDHFRRIGVHIPSVAEKYVAWDIINGYHAIMNESLVHDIIRTDPGVLYVEHDQYLDDSEPVEPTDRYDSDHQLSQYDRRWLGVEDIQNPFNLAMLSAASKLEEPTDRQGPPFYHLESAGEGVNIYILDSGVMTNHTSFGGRATNYQQLKDTDSSPFTGWPMGDTSTVSHGTCVASLAAGDRTGTAKQANIINLKVTGKGSTMTGLADALE